MSLKHACAALVALLGCWSARADEPQGPRLRVSETQLQLPELIQGQTAELEVELENVGDAPLRLNLVDVTCGCTVVSYPREPIPPGAKRPLTLRFDSTDKRGNVSVDAFLYSNDPTQNDRGAYCTRLTLRGEVGSHFRLRPASAAFGEVLAGGAAQTRELQVHGRGPANTALKLALREPAPDYLRVEAVPGDEPGKADVRVTLLPSAPPGDVLLYLEFATGVPEQPTLRVPVVAAITGLVRAPLGVDLRRIQRGAEATVERIPLTLSDGVEGVPAEQLPIHRLDYDRTRLAVEVEHISPRRADLLVRGLDAGPLGPFSAPIRVYFDLAQQPLLEIPVFGRVVGRVRVLPEALAGGARTLTVRGAAVRGARLEPALPGVEVELHAGEGATEVRLVGGELSEDAELILETDAPGEEQLRVAVLGG
ncbi:MAG: DUF1573 domain-containing protein [Planctomycetota bacterium]